MDQWIDAEAVVNSVKELMERVSMCKTSSTRLRSLKSTSKGANLRWSWQLRKRSATLVRLDLSQLPGTPRIASRDVKFERDSRGYKLTEIESRRRPGQADNTKLSETAVAAYRALRVRDYGRIDMRLTPEGEVYVIEANPNPWLSSKHEFAMAAKKSGRSYTQLIETIVDSAIERTKRTNEGGG
jgi:D-alanine-D-alanine ligase